MCAGKDGSYGTSVERYKALDPASDIILAFRHNGRLLTPDHGYPLRIIIPGLEKPHMISLLSFYYSDSINISAVSVRLCYKEALIHTVSLVHLLNLRGWNR